MSKNEDDATGEDVVAANNGPQTIFSLLRPRGVREVTSFLPPRRIKTIMATDHISIIEEGHAATRLFAALEEDSAITDTAFACDALRLDAETTNTADAFALREQGGHDGLRRVGAAVAPVM